MLFSGLCILAIVLVSVKRYRKRSRPIPLSDQLWAGVIESETKRERLS